MTEQQLWELLKGASELGKIIVREQKTGEETDKSSQARIMLYGISKLLSDRARSIYFDCTAISPRARWMFIHIYFEQLAFCNPELVTTLFPVLADWCVDRPKMDPRRWFPDLSPMYADA